MQIMTCDAKGSLLITTGIRNKLFFF